MTVPAGIQTVKGVSNDSIYAWKIAHVYVAPQHKMSLRFRPMITPHPAYGLDEIAICGEHAYHKMPPYDDCHCGFNAWHDMSVALEYHETLNYHDNLCHQYFKLSKRLECPALLRVRLSGDVIEGTLDVININKWGYRASRQLVMDVFFDKKCYQSDCENDPVGLSVTRHAYKLPRTPGVMFRPVRPACSRHEIRMILQPEDLMKANDVGVHIGYPSE